MFLTFNFSIFLVDFYFISFSLFKFVAIAPDRADGPTSKKYVTAQSNFFQTK